MSTWSNTSIACIRSSAHDLNIEHGRYSTKYKAPTVTDRTCRYCCGGEAIEVLQMLENLPINFNPIIESEEHVIVTCPAYHSHRINLSSNLKSLLMLHEFGTIMTSDHAEEFGTYLYKCHKMRKQRTNKWNIYPYIKLWLNCESDETLKWWNTEVCLILYRVWHYIVIWPFTNSNSIVVIAK